jgi:signal transduction histidine kinase
MGRMDCTLRASLDRILSIVREVGGFTSESAQTEFVEASLSEIVTRALRIAKVNAPAWLKLEADLDSEVKIDCHPEEIERVVTNLLVNSIQALAETRPSVGHLVVGVAAFEDRAIIHVEDDGAGIDSALLDRIFDPFFTTKPVGQGTGLGLAISYHIVKGHGGDIRVSSLPGRGTSVTVELPFAMAGS